MHSVFNKNAIFAKDLNLLLNFLNSNHQDKSKSQRQFTD
jgi:hypothetical protein